jgi:hypothetical protein
MKTGLSRNKKVARLRVSEAELIELRAGLGYMVSESPRTPGPMVMTIAEALDSLIERMG